VEYGSKKRVFALLFQRGVIALRVAIRDVSASGNGLGFKEHCFGKSAFAAAGVAAKDNIPDFVGGVNCHVQGTGWVK
jgi:hypothetical protein